MPRKPDPENDAHQRRQAAYRARLAKAGCPESGAVDKAAADALTAYGAICRQLGAPEGDKFFLGMRAAAVNLLVSRGYDRRQAKTRVIRRLQRLDADALIPASKGSGSDTGR